MNKKSFNQKRKVLVILFLTISTNFLIFSQNYKDSSLINKYLPKNANNLKFVQNNKYTQENDQYSEIMGLKIHKNIRNLNFISKNQKLEILILFRDDIDQSVRLNIMNQIPLNFIIKYNYDIISCVDLQISSKDLSKFIEYIKQFREIKEIKLNSEIKIDLSQYNFNYNSIKPQVESLENWWLDAIGFSNLSLTGKNVNIAILDTGITIHPDFYTDHSTSKSRIIKSKNFTSEANAEHKNYTTDSYGHGTHCAGIAAGNGYLSGGKYRGVASEANLLNAKISNASGSIEEANVIAAIDWCIKENADIISMSFGGVTSGVWNLEALAIEKAIEKGIIVVASAGNSGPNLYSASSPAVTMGAISVGAVDYYRKVVSFSSRGPSETRQLQPEICAPGVNIVSTEAEGSLISNQYEYFDTIIPGKDDFDYVALSGTSMACPMVAGAIALIKQVYPDIEPETVRNALFLGASQLTQSETQGYGYKEGAGLLNISKSLEILDIFSQNRSINDLISLYPRKIPYNPYNLIKFPGDSQIYNITAFYGNNKSFKVEFPNLEGINITGFPIVESNENGWSSIPFQIDILYNATLGVRFGYIQLIDINSDQILDQIPINISIAIPKTKIYFDTYHAFNDSPKSSLFFKQYEMFNAFSDLYKKNISVDFKLDNYTPNYNSSINAEILNYELLSSYDILVLQTPYIPYSDFEIEAIAKFYENGGSILFLGTLKGKMAEISLNTLFSRLNLTVNFGTNLFSYTDYGRSAFLKNYEITEFNEDSLIFNNISTFPFYFGCSFEEDPDLYVHASYQNQNIVVSKTSKDLSGKIVLFGDYHFLLDSIYSSETSIESNSLLLSNLVEFLQPNVLKSNYSDLSLRSQFQKRDLTDDWLNFSIYAINNSNHKIVDFDGYVNISIQTPTNDSIRIREFAISSGNAYGSIIFNSSFTGGLYEIHLCCNILNKTYNDSRYFYYFLNQPLSYSDIKLEDNYDFLVREPNILYNFKIMNSNSTISTPSPYISVINPSYLGFKGVDEFFIQNVVFNITTGTFLLNSSQISTVGILITYLTNIYTLDGVNYVDLTPSRIKFTVLNYIPQIDKQKSTFGTIKFASTQDNIGIYPIEVKFGLKYRINVTVNEVVEFEDKIRDFRVIASIYPIYVHRGYINFLNPISIPRVDLEFDENSKSYYQNIFIPTNMSYRINGEITNKSLETDMINLFALLWISVRDLDAGTSDFQIILMPYEDPPNTTNFIPVLAILGFLGAGVWILNLIQKKKIKKQGKL